MDSFLGIGFPELVMILLLAGLIMGPHRIRQVARTLGRYVAQLQAISRQFTRQLNAELDAMDSEELRGALEDVKQLRQEMNDLRRQVRSMPGEVTGEARKAVREGEQVFKGRSQVPPEAANPPDAKTEADNGTPKVPEVPKPSVPAPSSLPNPIDVPDDPA